MTKIEIFDSIKKINVSDWNKLISNNIESYDFYELLEKSNLKQFTFYYLTASENSSITTILPIFISDFDISIAANNTILKIISSIRKIFPNFFIIKTLFIGSPFGENACIGTTKTVIDKTIIKKIYSFAKNKKTSLIMFKDINDSDTKVIDSIKKFSFFKLKSMPSICVPINFTNIDEYLNLLSSSTRKNLKRKLKEINNSQPIEVKITNNVENIIDDIYNLYLNTYNAGTTKFELLTKEFFLNTTLYMKTKIKYFLYYIDNKLVSFNLCFENKNSLIDKFIGFDYTVSRKYNLYFYSWWYNINYCINKKIKFYELGQTDYEAKIKLGGKFIPLYIYLKHLNPVYHFLFILLSTILKPEFF